jgi:hypothetical protein
MMLRNGLPKGCCWNPDRNGKRRVRFRDRRTGFSTYLTGVPWSEDFMRQYAAAQGNGKVKPMPSTLLGGVAVKPGQKPDTVQPLIGVYLLLLEGRIIYIGSSLNMPKRVAAHRTNGRPFDQVFYIGTMSDEREVLERTLIRAINPPQNRAHRYRAAEGDAAAPHREVRR